MSEPTEYTSFRQRLDAVLRTRDAAKVQQFMIELEEWSAEQPSDPEYAMWLMIAGAPTLKSLHAEARQWLSAHGHGEAAALLGGGQESGSRGGSERGGKSSGGGGKSGGSGGKNAGKRDGERQRPPR